MCVYSNIIYRMCFVSGGSVEVFDGFFALFVRFFLTDLDGCTKYRPLPFFVVFIVNIGGNSHLNCAGCIVFAFVFVASYACCLVIPYICRLCAW